MSVMTNRELKEIVARQDNLSISIFMPTERMGREVQQNAIRLKNLINQAEEKLSRRGMSSADVRNLLEPLHDLVVDRDFWQHQSDSLAIFLSPGWYRRFRLPIETEEIVVVGDRYYIKTLLPLVQRDGQFWILALDLNNVRLLQASRFSVQEMALDDMPTSLAEVVQFDDTERQLQWHTGTQDRRGKRDAMFHGHGGAEDDSKTEILRFFQKLNNGLKEFFGDEQTPMVLAGVDYLIPIFREATSYSGLVDESITGSTKMMDAMELRDAAWKIVYPIFDREREEALRNHRNRSATGEVSEDIHEIMPAANFGRVETLFVARELQQWGKFDQETGRVELHDERQEGDEDLQNAVAVYTISNGGTVFALDVDELPGKEPIAATFRYRKPNGQD